MSRGESRGKAILLLLLHIIPHHCEAGEAMDPSICEVAVSVERVSGKGKEKKQFSRFVPGSGCVQNFNVNCNSRQCQRVYRKKILCFDHHFFLRIENVTYSMLRRTVVECYIIFKLVVQAQFTEGIGKHFHYDDSL